MLYLWASRILLAVGCLLIAAGASYGGIVGYMMWRESVSPSTSQVLVLKDGRRIPLVQPTQLTQPSKGSAESATPPMAEQSTNLGPAPSAPLVGSDLQDEGSEVATTLPPLRIKIGRIGVDWPVVLSNNEHMPSFKGVGWLMGSAFPGATGNLVLFGHLDGPYNTFGRLRELQAGDHFSVTTEQATHVYKVTSLFDTTFDDVEVLAPTDNATATLITCSGRWDPVAQDYSHRLIVKAAYLR